MLNKAKRITIKIGSSLLIDEQNYLRKEWLATLAQDIAVLRASGKQVIVVTSGAVALGRHPLGYGAKALTLEEKQAAAACGQITLYSMWATALRETSGGFYPAQLLLTTGEINRRRSYLNIRSTLETLLENPAIIPVINENDTVATAELRFGDNDRLAAYVAQMAGADALVLFSDIQGLYTANPKLDPKAKLIAEIHHGVTAEHEAMAGGSGSLVGTGGMVTKLQAAKIAFSAGCHMAIASGLDEHPLQKLAKGGEATWFIAGDTPLGARKRWIAGSLHAVGTVVIDAGAAQALKSGKSLLPAGVKAVQGEFERGDTVVITGEDGQAIGQGLSAYGAADARRILGRQSAEIEQILGFKGRSALIHRDDLVLR